MVVTVIVMNNIIKYEVNTMTNDIQENMPHLLVKDSNVVISSKIVAQILEKKHKNVLRDIRELGCSEEFGQANFEPVHKTINGVQIGTDVQEYLMTRDGFTLLTFGYTGERAARFKVAYINAFNTMEQELKKRRTISSESGIPKSYGEALLLAGKIEVEREKALLDNPDAAIRLLEKLKSERTRRSLAGQTCTKNE
jgi:Rha family phage regulatory protein